MQELDKFAVGKNIRPAGWINSLSLGIVKRRRTRRPKLEVWPQKPPEDAFHYFFTFDLAQTQGVLRTKCLGQATEPILEHLKVAVVSGYSCFPNGIPCLFLPAQIRI